MEAQSSPTKPPAKSGVAIPQILPRRRQRVRLIEGLYNNFSSGETFSADFVASSSFSQPFECRVNNASRLRLEGGVTRDNATTNWKKTGTPRRNVPCAFIAP